MRKKVLFIVVFFIAIGMLIVNSVRAYTYDGDIDPKHFFTYQPVLIEQLSSITVLMAVSNKDTIPQHAVICVMRVQGGVVILAYAYYDDKMNLQHFMIDTDAGHYNFQPFDMNNPVEADLHRKITKILNTLHGLSVS